MKTLRAETPRRRGGKKNRKHGRQKRRPAYKRYNAEARWITNKMRKLRRHMRRYIRDKQAARCLRLLEQGVHPLQIEVRLHAPT